MLGAGLVSMLEAIVTIGDQENSKEDEDPIGSRHYGRHRLDSGNARRFGGPDGRLATVLNGRPMSIVGMLFDRE